MWTDRLQCTCCNITAPDGSGRSSSRDEGVIIGRLVFPFLCTECESVTNKNFPTKEMACPMSTVQCLCTPYCVCTLWGSMDAPTVSTYFWPCQAGPRRTPCVYNSACRLNPVKRDALDSSRMDTAGDHQDYSPLCFIFVCDQSSFDSETKSPVYSHYSSTSRHAMLCHMQPTSNLMDSAIREG